MKKILIVIACILLLTACGKGKIVGKWYYYDGNSIRTDIYYEFNDDKTGSYTYISGKKSFIYDTKNGKVTLDYINSVNLLEFEYTIEGDTLTIKDSNGSNVVYKR